MVDEWRTSGHQHGRRWRARCVVALLLVSGVLVGAGRSPQPADAAEVAVEAQQGAWSEVGDWNFIPIHASLLDDGRVLTYGGTRTGSQGGFELDVWDPAQGLGAGAHTTIANDLGTNLFCSFSIDDPSQRRTLMLGGQLHNGRAPSFTAGFDGSNLADFDTMNESRWYPTATTLWDGRILVQGGVPTGFGSRANPVTVAEVHTPGEGWRVLEGTRNPGVWDTLNYGWWYPKSHVTPAGKVWNLAWNQMYELDPDGAGSVIPLGTFPTDNVGGSSASVMFDTGLVLQVGGGERGSDDRRFIGSNQATVIDLNYDPPRIRAAATMNFRRHWADAVVLPDGRVLVIGGSEVNNRNDGLALSPEVWDPATDTWTVLAANEIPRLYHSTTLLLPDGSIYTGGGGAPGPQNNLNAEVFYPPYLYGADGNRAEQPEILNAPSELTYGQRFAIDVDGPVDRVTLIKAGNNTHGMTTQIFQELTFTPSGGQLLVDAPDHATVATPGRYLLFVLDAAGVPSEARIVDLGGTGLTPPPPRERPTNLLVNGSFEAPDIAENGFAVVDTPGWTSTRADGRLELWDAGHNNVGSADGQQLAELNIDGPTTIGQDVTVTPGATYRWSIEHRGRDGTDTMEVLIDGAVVATVTNPPGAWRLATGTFVAPADATTIRFALRGVDAGGSANLVDDARIELVADPPPDEVELSGTVTETGGPPVAGVAVDLFDETRTTWLASATTDGDGVFRFTVPADRCYTVTVIAPTGRRLIGPGSNSGGAYLNRELCAGRDPVGGIDAELAPIDGGSPSGGGSVADGAGVGVAGVDIDLFAATGDGSRGTYLDSTSTTGDGTYRFELPGPGCYVHTFIAPAGQTFAESGTGYLNRGYCAAAGEAVDGIDAALTTGAGAGLGDRVTNADGSAAGGVAIDLFEAVADGTRGTYLRTTTTGADGRYGFDVPPGCYVVTFIAPDGATFADSGTRYLERYACVGAGEVDDTVDAVLS